jgi:hypothetical protein
MWSFVRSLLHAMALGLVLLFLAPFVLTLLLFSALRKDEAHFSH